MPIGTGALVCAGLTILLLLASGFWTNRTYSQFRAIPGHYDFRGNATRLTPLKQGAWIVPLSFSVLLGGFVVLLWFIPADMQNGDPSQGIIFISLTLLAGQGFVLWLLARWARNQQGNQ